MRKLYSWTIVGVCVLLCGWLITMLVRQPHELVYPVSKKPRIGDQAIIEISVLMSIPKSNTDYYERLNRGELKYATQDILVRCVESRAKKRTLAVYYLSNSGKQSLAYHVYLDYGAHTLKKRSVVRDGNSHVVPPGKPILGWPVPFTYWLTFDDMSTIEKKTPGFFSQIEEYTETRSAHIVWRGLHAILQIFDKQESQVYMRQLWKRGDWIWHEESCLVGKYGEYTAVRKMPIK